MHDFLERLEGVRQTGPGNWSAKCPAHADRSPSLSIKDAGDRLLVHCHAGCSAADITGAVGLQLRDLFAERLPLHRRQQMAQAASQTKLEAALHHELIVLELIIGNRLTDRHLAGDRAYREAHPEYTRFPWAKWDREVLAARRIAALIERLYPKEVERAA